MGTHPAFIRARAAAAAGIPVALVTGTPLLVEQTGIVWGALFAEVLVVVALVPVVLLFRRTLSSTRPASGGAP